MNRQSYRLPLLATTNVPTGLALASALIGMGSATAQQTPFFTPGNLVVVVEGCGLFAGTCVSIPNGTGSGTGNSSVGGYGDNQAAPLTLFQFAPVGTTSATYVNSLVLPQSAAGANFPVSGEYGSSSEGTLQLSGSGQYLAVVGYGINAATFDANPVQFGAAPSLALAQSGSLTGQSYTPVPRVVALVDANGNVNSSTALYNVFNTNNPRSAATVDGTSVYVSGQGSGSDATGGVFYSLADAVNNAPTAITGLDTTGNTIAQDTRDVQIVNNTLYVSVDSKAGSGSNRDFLGRLGAVGMPPTTTVGAPLMLNGFGDTGGTGKVTTTTGVNGTGNLFNAGLQINLSPENFFFANAATLYVTDSGSPKNKSATSALGDGGLQKWVNSSADGSGTWSLAYTLYKGLGLVTNGSTSGSTGLLGLAATVSGGVVQLFATNYTINDLDATYLYGVSDRLAYTTASQASGETFTQLAAAPSDSNFKGVSFAPTVAAPTPANVVMTPVLTRSGASLTVQITLSNTGGTAATGVALTGVQIGSTMATPLPYAVGTIAAGGSVVTTVSVPASAGVSGARSVLSVTGTYTGENFGSSLRVVLP